MATTSYVNETLPIGGRSFNPAFAEVLDATPTVASSTGNLYALVNNNGGAFNGFKIEFTSNANGGAGDFTYTNVGGVVKPTAGTITGMFLRAPDGTVIAQVTTGAAGFGNNKLLDFYNTLTGTGFETPNHAIAAALNSLFANSNVHSGSQVADHLTVHGYSYGEVFGNGGNDVLWSPGSGSRKLVGGAGNDVIRVENGSYEVHGAETNGVGGAAGQTDTLEIVGYVGRTISAHISKLTNIDLLRFAVANQLSPGSTDGAWMRVAFDIDKIGIASLPSVLEIRGSSGAPNSRDQIEIYTNNDSATTAGVTINLTGWTFKNWNAEESEVEIETNSSKALKDVVVGSMVGDEIRTYAGDDTIRGGRGADYMDGGDGNDTFIFGKGDAARGESVYGGGYGAKGGVADRMIILGDNDFTEAWVTGVEILAFGGAAAATFSQYIVGNESGLKTIQGNGQANTFAVKLTNDGYGAPAVDLSGLVFKSWAGNDKVKITGTKSADTIAGSTQGDVINGGRGSDGLQGNEGADTFVFSLQGARGVDRVADFNRGEGDTIAILGLTSAKLKAGKLAKSAFEIGLKADDRKDRIIYDDDTGVLRYDADGSGKQKAKIVAVLEDAAILKAADILLI